MFTTVMIVSLTLAGVSPGLARRALTVEEARRLALEFNRTYLQAKEGVRIAEADVTKARAGAFPQVSLNGSYNRSFILPSFFVQATDEEGQTESIEFKTGFKNAYGANLSVVQSIWQGGKVFTALSIARDYRKYSQAVEDQVAATVVFNSDVLFHDAILQRSRLEVLTKSHEAVSENLDVVEKMFSQGLVPEFEVLRARVEKSNLEPQILMAQSDMKLAQKRLKSFLGLDLDEDIELVQEAEVESVPSLPSVDSMVTLALADRPEMKQASFERDMRRKAIRIARADYWPSLSAVASYDWQAQSDRFTLDENISRSWTAGLRLTVPIFQGGRTRGSVTQAVAEHNQTLLRVQETRDNVRLEVEQAYDRLLQARESLETQKNTIALAEEVLRIADLSYESGVGTLLDVLSAQAALTQARELLAQATFTYRTARAGLKLATTIDLDKLQ